MEFNQQATPLLQYINSNWNFEPRSEYVTKILNQRRQVYYHFSASLGFLISAFLVVTFDSYSQSRYWLGRNVISRRSNFLGKRDFVFERKNNGKNKRNGFGGKWDENIRLKVLAEEKWGRPTWEMRSKSSPLSIYRILFKHPLRRRKAISREALETF